MGILGHLGETRSVIRHNWPLLLGNTLEWYEFSVYGYLAPEFTTNFFSQSALATWLGFAVTFAARPLGGVVLGWVADKYGRKPMLLVSIYGMIVATVGQGLLPTSTCCGDTGMKIGVPILILLRFAQGIFAGGEISGVSVYLAESTPNYMLGIAASTISLGGNCAFFISSGLCAVLHYLLTKQQMTSWGWRIPFILALFPGLLSARMRGSLQETVGVPHVIKLRTKNSQGGSSSGSSQHGADVDVAQLQTVLLSEQEGTPVEVTIERLSDGEEVPEGLAQHQGRAGEDEAVPALTHSNTEPTKSGTPYRTYALQVLLSVVATGGISALWYVGPIYAVDFLEERGTDSRVALTASALAQLIALFCNPLVGLLTDLYGVGKVTMAGSLSVAAAGLPVYLLVDMYPSNSIVVFVGVALVFGLFQGLAGSTIYLYNCEMFPTSVRATGVGIAYNIAVCYIGGIGPLLCTFLKTYTSIAPGWYISGWATISFLTMAVLRYMRARGIGPPQTHIRHTPY